MTNLDLAMLLLECLGQFLRDAILFVEHQNQVSDVHVQLGLDCARLGLDSVLRVHQLIVETIDFVLHLTAMR